MWIKKLPDDYAYRSSMSHNDVLLWRNRNVFVMDNHRCALWCWMQACDRKEKYNFLHIDRHYDFSDSFELESALELKDDNPLPYDKYSTIRRSDGELAISWDNYICMAYYCFPQWFQSTIFITQKHGTLTPGTNPFFEPFTPYEEELLPQKISSYLSNPADCLSGMKTGSSKLKWIVNIDIDVFFDSNKKILYTDDSIKEIAKTIQQSVENIQVITIALSPECLGGYSLSEQWGNAFSILRILSEELDLLNEFPFPYSFK